MADAVNITINGKPFSVAVGTTAAAAVISAGIPSRHSITNQPRAPLCGMGICLECRMTVNGVPHVKSCQLPCAEGMEISTDG